MSVRATVPHVMQVLAPLLQKSTVLSTPNFISATTQDTSTIRKDLGLCAVCYQYLVLQKQVSLLKSNFGTLDEIFLRSGCPVCDFLYRSLGKRISAPLPRCVDNVANKKVGCWIRKYMINPSEILVIYDGIAQFTCQLIVDLPAFEQRKQEAAGLIFLPPRLRNWARNGDGSIIDPQWIYKFIQDCSHARSGHHHAKGCGSNKTWSLSKEPPMKLALIDVQQLCIVQADTTYRYCGLSYVWGGAQVLRTTKHNREALKIPGAFTRFLPAPIVQDAMQLTESIGVRYLWVDGLCIPQDDKYLTGFYINRMDYIYSQSVITIVAASSTSAMDRLSGVQAGSRAPQYTPKMGPMRIVRSTLELEAPLEETKYEVRAWSK